MTKQSIFLEDFVAGVTHESPPYLVTEEEAIWFAQRYDPQPIHVDAIAAKDSVFGGLVCGGFQTMAIVWALAQKTGMFKNAIAGMGVDEMRWLAPVRPGDVVRCRFTALDWRPSGSRPGAGILPMYCELVNQDDRPVITLVMTQLMRRRPAANL